MARKLLIAGSRCAGPGSRRATLSAECVVALLPAARAVARAGPRRALDAANAHGDRRRLVGDMLRLLSNDSAACRCALETAPPPRVVLAARRTPHGRWLPPLPRSRAGSSTPENEGGPVVAGLEAGASAAGASAGAGGRLEVSGCAAGGALRGSGSKSSAAENEGEGFAAGVSWSLRRPAVEPKLPRAGAWLRGSCSILPPPRAQRD